MDIGLNIDPSRLASSNLPVRCGLRKCIKSGVDVVVVVGGGGGSGGDGDGEGAWGTGGVGD